MPVEQSLHLPVHSQHHDEPKRPSSLAVTDAPSSAETPALRTTHSTMQKPLLATSTAVKLQSFNAATNDQKYTYKQECSSPISARKQPHQPLPLSLLFHTLPLPSLLNSFPSQPPKIQLGFLESTISSHNSGYKRTLGSQNASYGNNILVICV